jgi:hypothetical protein
LLFRFRSPLAGFSPNQQLKIWHSPFHFHAKKPNAFENVGKKALNPKIPGGRLRFYRSGCLRWQNRRLLCARPLSHGSRLDSEECAAV